MSFPFTADNGMLNGQAVFQSSDPEPRLRKVQVVSRTPRFHAIELLLRDALQAGQKVETE